MITKKDFEEMVEELIEDLKSRYIEDCPENESIITFSKIKGGFGDPEKNTLRLIYEKENLDDNDREVTLTQKVGTIYGMDMILTKKVKAYEAQEVQKDMRTIADWIMKIFDDKLFGIFKEKGRKQQND